MIAKKSSRLDQAGTGAAFLSSEGKRKKSIKKIVNAREQARHRRKETKNALTIS